MNKRTICIFSAAILLVVAVSAYFFYMISLSDNEIPDAVIYEETEGTDVSFPIDGAPETKNAVTLSPPESGETGAASYLLDTDFVLNEEDLSESLQAFFSAPCVLDFYLEEEGEGIVYRCANEEENSGFGAVLSSADFSVISMRKYDAAVAAGSVENPYHEASYRRAYFANEIGQVSLIIGKDGTYLDFYRRIEGSADRTESGRTFFAATDLYDDLLAVKNAMGEDCVPLN